MTKKEYKENLIELVLSLYTEDKLKKCSIEELEFMINNPTMSEIRKRLIKK